ncbi:hypothetical protein C8R46DRAFT_1105111 [Mycena filopes]|nr:hypothetical protein C8R46DRAFT_1105111 [Mycena filopes]
MASHLVTQFTEDLAATEATNCERLKCKAPIAVGEPRHYIAGFNSQKGKFVCERCHAHYKIQPSTVSREDAAGPDQNRAIMPSQAQDVRRAVNASRRKGSSNSERRVTAVPGQFGPPQASQSSLPLSYYQGAMMPPPPPVARPTVSIPSTWGQPQPYASSFPPIPSQPPNYGYSSAHAQYAANRQMWAKRTYQHTPGETITLAVIVVASAPGVSTHCNKRTVGYFPCRPTDIAPANAVATQPRPHLPG